MEYRNLRPSQVILDPDNPRLPDGTSSNGEAIKRLLDDGQDALVSLARDMAKTGQANPAELPIAIKHQNKYLILEGNRRFAALQLLKDPALADNEEQEKLFRRAALLGAPPKTVLTLVVVSREEADPWIVLRHTGGNNGVGVKRWSADQIATHRRRANRSIDSGTLRSIVIADDLEETYTSDQEIVELIHQIRRGKLTNIGRFFASDVLTALHFSIIVDDNSSMRSRTLLVRHTSEQLRDFFAWALAYILRNAVDAYKNAGIRQETLRSIGHLLPSLSDASSEPFRLIDRRPPTNGPNGAASTEQDSIRSTGGNERAENESEDSPTTQDSASEGPAAQDANDDRDRPRKREARPERYLLQNLKLPNHPERIQRILRECRSLNVEEYPSIACVMIRVVVELSVSSQSALALSGVSEDAHLKVKIVHMLKYLDPDIENPRRRDPELAQAFMEASELGVQYMHSFVHNPNVVPDPHLARRFSAAFRPLLARVDEAL